MTRRPTGAVVGVLALVGLSLASIPTSAEASASTASASTASAGTATSGVSWRSGTSAVRVGDLRADATTRPLGIDNPRPSLSWVLDGPGHGLRQSAYRVLVATSKDRLTPGRADVWDSGTVRSSTSVGVPYDGKTLTSSTRYYWTVQVRDQDGRASRWSAPTSWETGLLSADDWAGAAFVGPDSATANTWKDFTYEADFTIESAAASFLFRVKDASNYYMWQINTATKPGSVMLRPHAQVGGRFSNLDEIDLAPVVTPENVDQPHHLAITADGATITTRIDGTVVDTREDTSLPDAGTLGFRVSSTAGQAERARYDNLRVSAPDGTVLFSDDFATQPDPYFPNTPITDGQLAPTSDTILAREPESPMMRSEFSLAKPIASARAYVYGLGLYELHLNGSKVGDEVLTPTNGQYGTRNIYDTYDVTRELRRGENAVGLWLAEGYGKDYSQYAFRHTEDKRAALLLKITYTDGSVRTVTTDDGWTWSTGPVVSADLYAGEQYDARLEQRGWDRPDFDDNEWAQVRTLPAPPGGLVADLTPRRRVVSTIRPTKVTEPKPGVFVFDLGQNIAGWSRLHVRGSEGTRVTMAAAEEVGSDGLIDTRTNRSAAATDTYVLKGGDSETWEPRFTYHGFRYVQVTGFPGRPTASSLDGRVVHADVESTGTFDSSDDLLDTIWQNNRWAILNNSMSTPTDTPVRDERTPPSMDVQAYKDASTREFGMDRFYAKYLEDLPPGVALPTDDVKSQYPDMAGGQVSLAWTLYEQYGDRDTLARQYDAMTRFVDRNVDEKPSLIWPSNEGFGDWCPPVHGDAANGGMGSPSAGDCFSEVSLVNTALWYQQAVDVAKAADALGHADDAAHFTDVAARIKDAFNAHFLDEETGTYGSGRMTTSVLPLALGMVPDAVKEKAGDRLVRTVMDENGGHLDTGIFGTRYLVDALAAVDRVDVAMTVLGKRTYPSFGFQIEHGATTPWEQWTYDAGMITHDHAMFAGISSSLYTVLGGITPTAPGYASQRIAPVVPAGLDRVSVTQDTVHGTVASSWERSRRQLTLTVTVPANTTARIDVPLLGANPRDVRAPRDATRVDSGEGRSSYEVGSGTYRFEVALPRG